MVEYPEKITKIIFSYSNLSLKLHVKILNEKKEPLHNEYEFGGKKYLRLDQYAFLTLDIMNHGEWDTSKSIMLTQFNIFALIQSLKKIIKDIYDAGIFAVKKNGDIVIYREIAQKHKQTVPILNSSSVLIIEPTIVYDENEVGYEGVNIYINKVENVTQLSIQYFEALCYTLQQIDLFRYSQMILNYFVAYYGAKEKIFKPEKPKVYVKQNVDFSVPKEKTTANFRRTGKDILDELGVIEEN